MDYFAMLDINAVEPEVNIQLPTEVWPNAWTWSGDVVAENLTKVLANLPVEPIVPCSARVPFVDGVGEYSPAESTVTSFNSIASSWSSLGPNLCSTPPTNDSFNHSFSSAPAGSPSGYLQDPSAMKDRRLKKKAPSVMSLQSEDKDLDYRKYKTRLCRNWQQTGKCPYGDTCVYAHGSKELRGEPENEAVVSSLSKLAGQLIRHGGSAVASTQQMPPLRPLRYRKPKTDKKSEEQQSPMPCPVFPTPGCYAPIWGQA